VSSTVANWFTQDNALMASNNGALVLQRVAKKLKYSARCTGLGGSETERARLDEIHFLHLQKAPEYFLMVLVAFPCNAKEGSASASSRNSGSSIAATSFQIPCLKTSETNERVMKCKLQQLEI